LDPDILKVLPTDLLTLWLADQVYEIVKDEDVALKAIQVAEEEVRYHSKLITYFKYPAAIRKLVYTTNAIEGSIAKSAK